MSIVKSGLLGLSCRSIRSHRTRVTRWARIDPAELNLEAIEEKKGKNLAARLVNISPSITTRQQGDQPSLSALSIDKHIQKPPPDPLA